MALLSDDPAMDDPGILHSNWKAWNLFLECITQWRYAGMSGARVGLDYSGVQAVMKMHQVKPRKQAKLFRQIQLIERGAIAGASTEMKLEELIG